MNITFTGKQHKLTASQERKLATQFAKLSKLLEKRGEKVAQVALSAIRQDQQAEIRINFYDQTLVAAGRAADQFTALMDAIGKVEKQALKLLSKYRDSKRDTPVGRARTESDPSEIPVKPAPVKEGKAKAVKAAKSKPARPAKVVRAGAALTRKPMTLEEAMLTMEGDKDYMVYHDSDTGGVSVLIRRKDGKVDLVEA